MNGVTINGKHSFNDFGLYLQPKSIPAPKAKTKTVSIEGANGEIDLSTVLTDGDIKYQNRVFKLNFVAIGYGSTHAAIIERFMNNVHGKTVRLVFDDDTTHYFTGRCEVTNREFNNGYTVIECEFNVEPYRYDVSETVISKTISGDTSIICNNARQWLVPSINASAEMTLNYKGTLYQIVTGEHVYDMVVLRDGVNTLNFSGNGTVTIKYRQGVL